MKIFISVLDGTGTVQQLLEFPLKKSALPATLDDIPINLENVGRRYLFVSFPRGVGNLTVSVRKEPLLGYKGSYASIADFTAFVNIKKMPASFLYRFNKSLFIQIHLEG